MFNSGNGRSLKTELTIILIIKTFLLYLVWWLFFSSAERPDVDGSYMEHILLSDSQRDVQSENPLPVSNENKTR